MIRKKEIKRTAIARYDLVKAEYQFHQISKKVKPMAYYARKLCGNATHEELRKFFEGEITVEELANLMYNRKYGTKENWEDYNATSLKIIQAELDKVDNNTQRINVEVRLESQDLFSHATKRIVIEIKEQ